MENDTTRKLLENLENLNQKSVEVEQKGFVESYISMKKLNYNLEYDILKIQDESSDAYLKINLNQIYEVNKTDKQICILLDNDMKIIIRF